MKVLKALFVMFMIYGLFLRLNSVAVAIAFGLTCFGTGIFIDRKGYIDQILDRLKWIKKEEN